MYNNGSSSLKFYRLRLSSTVGEPMTITLLVYFADQCLAEHTFHSWSQALDFVRHLNPKYDVRLK